MTIVFLDTDVILDLFVERETYHSVAPRFFSHLQMQADCIQAYTSPVVFANVCYILGKARSEAYAIQTPGADFEDSLQYHCATASAVKIIITRNGADVLGDGVQTMQPHEFMKMDASGRSR